MSSMNGPGGGSRGDSRSGNGVGNGDRKFKRFSGGAMRRQCDDKEDPIDYKNLPLLQRYLTPQGKLQSRKRTKYCAQCQRLLAQAVRRARFVGLLPYVV